MGGEIYVWGGNSSGQVGDCTRADRELPKMILGTGTVKLRSNKEVIDKLMQNCPPVDDGSEAGLSSRPSSGGQFAAVGAAVVGSTNLGPPQLMLRAAGVSG